MGRNESTGRQTFRPRGFTIPQVLVFASIAVAVTTALAGFLGTVLRSSAKQEAREQALQIAESGIEYYRWHLAHAQTDYQDGTGQPGPYVHDYEDADGRKIGTFTLEITPPPPGSTVVVVKSTGEYLGSTTAERAIQATMAVPSVARFAIAVNDDVRIGAGTITEGPVHGNGGVRFDGVARNIVSSAKDVYDDPDHSGANEFGVHTHVSPVDPLPPAAVPDRSDIFTVGREFPVPAIDFAGMVADLADIKAKAQANGRYYNASGKQGFRVVLKSNDTYDLYTVTTKNTPPSGCSNATGDPDWDTWSIKTQTFMGNYAFPANGLMFFEDNVWVEGNVTTARLTIAAARFPDAQGQRRNIIVTGDIVYGAKDGSAVLGLIAQNSVNVGLSSDNDLEVDAAMVAQNGRVGRHYYGPNCGTGYTRSSITTYGSIVSKARYGFAWTDGTGYQDRNLVYDPHLLYAPPPEFPLTTDRYEVLSWEEVEP
jgi:type II secretory pathway pseudopilin PulG